MLAVLVVALHVAVAAAASATTDAVPPVHHSVQVKIPIPVANQATFSTSVDSYVPSSPALNGGNLTFDAVHASDVEICASPVFSNAACVWVASAEGIARKTLQLGQGGVWFRARSTKNTTGTVHLTVHMVACANGTGVYIPERDSCELVPVISKNHSSGNVARFDVPFSTSLTKVQLHAAAAAMVYMDYGRVPSREQFLAKWNWSTTAPTASFLHLRPGAYFLWSDAELGKGGSVDNVVVANVSHQFNVTEVERQDEKKWRFNKTKGVKEEPGAWALPAFHLQSNATEDDYEIWFGLIKSNDVPPPLYVMVNGIPAVKGSTAYDLKHVMGGASIQGSPIPVQQYDVALSPNDTTLITVFNITKMDVEVHQIQTLYIRTQLLLEQQLVLANSEPCPQVCTKSVHSRGKCHPESHTCTCKPSWHGTVDCRFVHYTLDKAKLLSILLTTNLTILGTLWYASMQRKRSNADGVSYVEIE